LCFEEPDDGCGDSKTDLVPAERLGTLLANYKIPLVVLEACRSATVGKTAVFRSVAPRLIQAGVGSVLSMGHAVHVEAARLLLDRFYRELVRGTTIGQAVAEARTALIATPARWIETGPGGRTIELRDWFLPHLYQREGDDALVPTEAARQQPVRQFEEGPKCLFGRLGRRCTQCDQGDHVTLQIGSSRRIHSQCRQCSRKWNAPAFPCLSLGVKGQCFLGISQCFIHIVAGRETAGKIRKPDSDGLVRPGIFDNGNIMRHRRLLSVRLPSSLPIDIRTSPCPKRFFG